MILHAGLDVGSTTVKVVALDENDQVVYSIYRRHKSDVKKTVQEVLEGLYETVGDQPVQMAVTGSGGMFLEQLLGIPFVQEVIAETNAIRRYLPETDVIIELGGEDSKITYLSGNVEQRMNSICAGGTGAFIDQMANLLNTDAAGLDQLAAGYTRIYPIASRCGVFAKTDVQSLLNDGVSKENIAISVFQSVVNQTIANLACGRPIEGTITFLGGPLHFLQNLRGRFVDTLGEDSNTFVMPENSQLFVARGAALKAQELSEVVPMKALIETLHKNKDIVIQETDTMDPLFRSEEEYEQFKKDHETSNKEVYQDIRDYHGPVYLGIDAGSTTSKEVLIGEDNQILYTQYSMNKGQPLEHVIRDLKEIYGLLNEDAYIANAGICGYGEDFIRAALDIDFGEVETIAHYTAAKYYNPNVDFILDIGGQDMKAMHITDGVIDSIQLNEACSSGCGSFLSTFAASVGMSAEEFQKEALFAKAPVDLGSRCTVFMNSRVKQAQKQGASLADIAAGLSYSVIRNALQKVIKVRDPRKLGKNLVVQGGTFLGDAILRSFEIITGRQATRPAIAGLMGAMGMALLAKERTTGVSTIKTAEELEKFSYRQQAAHCGRCTNNCALTINIFSDGSRYISGNRCERGAGIQREDNSLPNLYQFKLDRLFNYYPALSKEHTRFPAVGLPRVLNMFENYPFWYTFFSRLGFPVVLSDPSSHELYNSGLATISDETVCYPAKLVTGHIENLMEKGVRLIFYPAVFYEHRQFDRVDNQINCPVVCGMPEVVKNNVDSMEKKGICFMDPFVSFKSEKTIQKILEEAFQEFTVGGESYRISKKEIRNAVHYAWEEEQSYHEDIRKEGARAIRWCKDHADESHVTTGIVLSGRPYHIDAEVNHGIPELINGMGLAVLSEDAVAMNIPDLSEQVRVLDQWVYHSRLYRAAEYVAKTSCLELIQLNSFGCGLDAVTSDQVQEILKSKGKIYTLLKIDEVSNLGAVKIRIRSLVQALENQAGEELLEAEKDDSYEVPRLVFTEEMREDYTILVPAMAPDHFRILQKALASEGYHIDFLDKVDSDVINAGLKYVNNDSCYPSITVVGQMMEALESGRYDPDRTALLMTQTGGACRASNYVGYIRKALQDMGYPQIPVIALSAQGIETSPGFRPSLPLLSKAVYALVTGDVIQRCSNRMRMYEVNPGETDRKKEYWLDYFSDWVQDPSASSYKEAIQTCIDDFDHIPIRDITIPRAGIVGEILVKYLPEANNHLQQLLEAEGAEVCMPDLMDFFMYCLRNQTHRKNLLGEKKSTAFIASVGVKLIERYRKPAREGLRRSEHFSEPLPIQKIEEDAEELVSLGNQYGEGWLLAGEMVELIHAGYPNIVCIQPFGCLPNHITGKGVMKAVRQRYPQANLVAIDYDPGASEVNQVNRVKLMMTSAWDAIGGKPKEVVEKDMAENKKRLEAVIGQAAAEDGERNNESRPERTETGAAYS